MLNQKKSKDKNIFLPSMLKKEEKIYWSMILCLAYGFIPEVFVWCENYIEMTFET